MDKPHAASHSDSLHVKAGAFVTIPVVLDAKSQVVEYSFAVVDGVVNGMDVELSCTLQDPNAGTSPAELLPAQRVQDIFGSMRVNLELPRGAHAVLEFRLSNAFSWMREKSVTYKISVIPEQDPVEVAKKEMEKALLAVRGAEAEAARLEVAAELAITAQTRAVLEVTEAEAAAEAAARVVTSRREACAVAESDAAAATALLEAARAAVASAQAAAATLAASPLLQPTDAASAAGGVSAPPPAEPTDLATPPVLSQSHLAPQAAVGKEAAAAVVPLAK